eukprot:COSAG02_NODE_2905_length_7774_cov_8.299935_3_plen_142_part_00
MSALTARLGAIGTETKAVRDPDQMAAYAAVCSVILALQAGTPYGCANKTIRGAVPNEHGTWYLGRNGWCDGLDVKPLVWDVTEGVDLEPGGTNTLQYFGWSYGDTDDPSRHSEDGCGGTMNMISFLLFFGNAHGLATETSS